MSDQLYTCRWTGYGATSFRGRTYLQGQINDFDVKTALSFHNDKDSRWECMDIDRLKADLEAAKQKICEQDEKVLVHDGSIEGVDAVHDVINDDGLGIEDIIDPDEEAIGVGFVKETEEKSTEETGDEAEGTPELVDDIDSDLQLFGENAVEGIKSTEEAPAAQSEAPPAQKRRKKK